MLSNRTQQTVLVAAFTSSVLGAAAWAVGESWWPRFSSPLGYVFGIGVFCFWFLTSYPLLRTIDDLEEKLDLMEARLNQNIPPLDEKKHVQELVRDLTR